MTEYVIEKGVPLTGKVELLSSMTLGDSFVVKTKNEREAFRERAKAYDMKIVSRKIEDGYRIWRTA